MECPFCHQPMVCGKLYAPAEEGVYWLPNTTSIHEIKGWRLTAKGVQEAGGIVLDKLRRIGFLAKERPDSFYCASCGIFLTKQLHEQEKS